MPIENIRIVVPNAAHTEDEERFIRKCRQYTDLMGLTSTILNDLVSRVFVEAPDKSDGKRK
ncbi:DUF4368 domain-containing protein [Lacrimispora amygdalina]|uniref:DUF4368 domain-containing protein n=1 Tax=Lacrimispora amygdalina TaxID=253257 RepID=UPI001FA81A59|nr:DUF4368 domain-containing protein [Clostridium indicum]